MGKLPLQPRAFWNFPFTFLRMHWIQWSKSYLWHCLNLLGSASPLQIDAIRLHTRVTWEVDSWKCRCPVNKREKEEERKKEKISFAEGSGMPFTHPVTACSEIMWDREMQLFPWLVSVPACLIWCEKLAVQSVSLVFRDTSCSFDKAAPHCDHKPKPTSSGAP